MRGEHHDSRGDDGDNGCDGYDDIIGLPHHVSAVHPHMSRIDRAAQFAPFSALSGFGAAIRETGRVTEEEAELSEDARDLLDEELRMIQEQAAGCPDVVITYFKPDERKEGGAYTTVSGRIKKIDTCGRILVMEDGTKIPFDAVAGIERGKGE